MTEKTISRENLQQPANKAYQRRKQSVKLFGIAMIALLVLAACTNASSDQSSGGASGPARPPRLPFALP